MTSRDTLVAYLKLKADEEDWHGVADAAMDLRELDAVERGQRIPSRVRTLPERPCDHPLSLRRYNSNSAEYECACGAHLGYSTATAFEGKHGA